MAPEWFLNEFWMSSGWNLEKICVWSEWDRACSERILHEVWMRYVQILTNATAVMRWSESFSPTSCDFRFEYLTKLSDFQNFRENWIWRLARPGRLRLLLFRSPFNLFCSIVLELISYNMIFKNRTGIDSGMKVFCGIPVVTIGRFYKFPRWFLIIKFLPSYPK